MEFLKQRNPEGPKSALADSPFDTGYSSAVQIAEYCLIIPYIRLS